MLCKTVLWGGEGEAQIYLKEAQVSSNYIFRKNLNEEILQLNDIFTILPEFRIESDTNKYFSPLTKMNRIFCCNIVHNSMQSIVKRMLNYIAKPELLYKNRNTKFLS